MFFGEPDFNKLDTTERNIGYALSHDFGNGLTFRQNTRYSKLDFLLEQVYDASLDPSVARQAYTIDADVERFRIDKQLQYDTAFGDIASRTLVGVDHTRDRLRERQQNGTAAGIDPNDPIYCGTGCITLGDAFNTNIDQNVTGLYAQQELTFDDRWIVTLGGRYDYAETTRGGVEAIDESFTKRVGLTYKASDELSLYANYSESFQPLGNPTSTDPQEGHQYEVGAKYRPANSNALFTAALFDLTQTNVATFVPPADYLQVGEINVKGVELEAKVAMTEQFNISAAYSYWDAEITKDGVQSNVGNTPLLTADHLFSIWAIIPSQVRAIAGI